MATIAGITFAFIGARLSGTLEQRLGAVLGNTIAIPVHTVIVVAGIGLLIALHRRAGTKLRHIRHVVSHPPLPLAIVGAMPVASIVGRLIVRPGAAFSFAETTALAGAYFLLWLAQTLIENGSARKSDVPSPTPKEALNDERLRDWLLREEPAIGRDADLFGHAHLAERIVDRLAGCDTTIALQGEFGSGKSTLCRMVAEGATRRGLDLIPVTVSCWGFDNAARAQQDVLAAIVREVNRETDCLALRHLPADYIDAVSADIGWFRSLLRSGIPERTPVEQLRRLSPILATIGRRVVVVIEDVDRTGAGFDVALIQSLLMQFREVPRLSFILAISPGQRIDFAKLCDHLETMPPLERGQILRLIDRTRESLLREHQPGIILNKLDPLSLREKDERMFESHLEYHWPWQLSLCGLLDRPRMLKHALRRLADAWPRLKGEVHFDHLISAAALRVGAPEAFQFFVERHVLFGPAAKPPNSNLRPEARIDLLGDLQKEWLEAARRGGFDERSAGGLMRDILPAAGTITGRQFAYTNIAQSMQSERRRHVYARRLFTEHCDSGEVSDQRMLDMLQRADADPKTRADLAEAITHSEFASLAFEDLYGPCGFRGHLDLLTEVYAVMRRQPHAAEDRDDTPGFFAPWRKVTDNRPENFEPWLIAELKKCVPSQIRLLTDIYYFWLGTNRHTRAEREGPRAAIVAALKDAWANATPAEIAAGFSPRVIYGLFHLVFTTDFQQPQDVPHGTAADWAWSGAHLTKACAASPEVMVPQIVVALNADSERGSEFPRYKLDEANLDAWFGSEAGSLLELLAAGTVLSEQSEWQRKLLELGISEAARLRDRRRPSKAGQSDRDASSTS